MRGSVPGYDRCLAPVELVVEADFEDMFVGAHVQRLVKGERITKRRASYCEGNVFGTETQVVVFKLGRPVIEEGIFQTETDQQTIERGAPLRGGAKVAAVYICRVPVKSARYLARLAVNKCPVKGDAKSPGNVVIPFVSDAGACNQRITKSTKPKLITGNFHPGPETFTLDAENEHADLVVAADLAAGETAHAVPVTNQIKRNTTA